MAGGCLPALLRFCEFYQHSPKLLRAPVAQLDRACASGAQGRAFKSPQARHLRPRYQELTPLQLWTEKRFARKNRVAQFA